MNPKTRILVVEDEPGLSALISEVLEEEGCSVVAARDGREAVDILEEQMFDLVLTDINMPRMTGLELLEWMRAAGRGEKVMTMTASSGYEDLEAEGYPQVAAQFRKPFRLPQLVDAVEQVAFCWAPESRSASPELGERSARAHAL